MAKNSADTSKSDAFEMIELAVDGVELLERAFDLISQVCLELDEPEVHLNDELQDKVLH